jgi:hypothetical protein
LRDWARMTGYSEEKVLKRIRMQWLPRDLKVIFLSTDVNLEVALIRVEEWEQMFEI